jgi:hypothetical protein
MKRAKTRTSALGKVGTRSFVVGARRLAILRTQPCPACGVATGPCRRLHSGDTRSIMGIHAARLLSVGFSIPERGENPYGSSLKTTRAEIDAECDRVEKRLRRQRSVQLGP